MRTKFDIYVFIKFTQKLYMVIIEIIRLASHLWCCLFKFMASFFFGTLLFDQFPVTLNINNKTKGLKEDSHNLQFHETTSVM
jgi:hypothetical protein